MIDLNSAPRDIEAGAERADPLDPPDAADFERDDDAINEEWEKS